MLGWWKRGRVRRAALQARVLAEADRLQVEHGAGAYGAILRIDDELRYAGLASNAPERTFAWAVRVEVATRVGHRIGLDTGTKYELARMAEAKRARTAARAPRLASRRGG